MTVSKNFFFRHGLAGSLMRTSAIIADKFSLSLVSSISRHGNSSLLEPREKYPGQRKGTNEREREREWGGGWRKKNAREIKGRRPKRELFVLGRWGTYRRLWSGYMNKKYAANTRRPISASFFLLSCNHEY